MTRGGSTTEYRCDLNGNLRVLQPTGKGGSLRKHKILLSSRGVDTLARAAARLSGLEGVSELRPQEEARFEVYIPAAGRRLVYTTKPSWLNNIAHPGAGLVIIGQRPWPSRSARRFLRGLSATFGTSLVFVGDLDPVDLSIACLLAAHVAPTPVLYGGVDDAWLALCRKNWTGRASQSAAIMAQSPPERRLLAPLLDAWPDIMAVLGTQSEKILRDGLKLELEGATNPFFYSKAHGKRVVGVIAGKR